MLARAEPSQYVDACRDVSLFFGRGNLVAMQGSRKVTLVADVGYGIAQYTRGETIDQVYRRAKELCEENQAVACP